MHEPGSTVTAGVCRVQETYVVKCKVEEVGVASSASSAQEVRRSANMARFLSAGGYSSPPSIEISEVTESDAEETATVEGRVELPVEDEWQTAAERVFLSNSSEGEDADGEDTAGEEEEAARTLEKGSVPGEDQREREYSDDEVFDYGESEMDRVQERESRRIDEKSVTIVVSGSEEVSTRVGGATSKTFAGEDSHDCERKLLGELHRDYDRDEYVAEQKTDTSARLTSNERREMEAMVASMMEELGLEPARYGQPPNKPLETLLEEDSDADRTPTATAVHSRQGSSASSDVTAVYNPGAGSRPSSCEVVTPQPTLQPKSLLELSCSALLSRPGGALLLRQIRLWEAPSAASTPAPTPPPPPLAFSPTPSTPAPTPPPPPPTPPDTEGWTALPSRMDPNLLLCLSPSQGRSLYNGGKTAPDADTLLDLHRKFLERRSYGEPSLGRQRGKDVTDDRRSSLPGYYRLLDTSERSTPSPSTRSLDADPAAQHNSSNQAMMFSSGHQFWQQRIVDRGTPQPFHFRQPSVVSEQAPAPPPTPPQPRSAPLSPQGSPAPRRDRSCPPALGAKIPPTSTAAAAASDSGRGVGGGSRLLALLRAEERTSRPAAGTRMLKFVREGRAHSPMAPPQQDQQPQQEVATPSTPPQERAKRPPPPGAEDGARATTSCGGCCDSARNKHRPPSWYGYEEKAQAQPGAAPAKREKDQPQQPPASSVPDVLLTSKDSTTNAESKSVTATHEQRRIYRVNSLEAGQNSTEKEYQRLRHEILERRYSLPSRYSPQPQPPIQQQQQLFQKSLDPSARKELQKRLSFQQQLQQARPPLPTQRLRLSQMDVKTDQQIQELKKQFESQQAEERRQFLKQLEQLKNEQPKKQDEKPKELPFQQLKKQFENQQLQEQRYIEKQLQQKQEKNRASGENGGQQDKQPEEEFEKLKKQFETQLLEERTQVQKVLEREKQRDQEEVENGKDVLYQAVKQEKKDKEGVEVVKELQYKELKQRLLKQTVVVDEKKSEELKGTEGNEEVKELEYEELKRMLVKDREVASEGKKDEEKESVTVERDDSKNDEKSEVTTKIGRKEEAEERRRNEKKGKRDAEMADLEREEQQLKGQEADLIRQYEELQKLRQICDDEEFWRERRQEVVDQEGTQTVRRFEASRYRISKRGDIAVERAEAEAGAPPLRLLGAERQPPPPPPASSERFRDQMFREYERQLAERAERRRRCVLRVSGAAEAVRPPPPPPPPRLEAEFMGRVRQRQQKLGLPELDQEEEEAAAGDRGGGGGGAGGGRELPKHLQEFIELAQQPHPDSEDSDEEHRPIGRPGVWTPSPKLSSAGTPEPGAGDSQQQREQQQQQVEGGDTRSQGESPAPAPVWTPQASPTVERRHFRPVNFSPTPQQQQQRREEAQPEPHQKQQQQQAESARPPWENHQQQQQGQELQAAGSGRLVQSQSAPVGGLSGLALPRAPNPTVTLLQKAREGQLPRGALYLDHKMSSKESDKPIIGQNEILYSVKSEYEKEVEGQRKKIVELGPRKFEGIGPTTKDGIPIVLRSEVKDSNQAKWYKRMYDSLHRTGKDDDYITIYYKPRRGRYPYTSPGGYLSEPEIGGYDSDAGYSSKYATLDRRRIKNKENDFTTSTLPRSKYVPHPSSIKYATEIYKNQPGRIEDYEPGHSSISEREAKQQAANEQHTPSTPNKSFMTYALKDGYESDSTLVFKRRDDQVQEQLSPAEQKMAYKAIQRGGEVPLQGLRKPAPQRPKESPHRYVESEVTIHYRSPVRAEAKEALSEEELARRQAEAMRRIYQEERRRKYLQELQDMHSRRHTDNFTPSQKSPIPLNRYDDFLDDVTTKSRPRDKTPEPKLVARALYNFVGQTSRELSFRRGDIIFVRRQIDKNWYEGEHNAMVGLFPLNYVEIIPYDGIRTMPKKPTEGQARAKFNFIAQTHLELSLVKGELVVLTRRVDENWYEGRIGNRKGIFPVSYVEVLQEPGDNRTGTLPTPTKTSSTPTVQSVLVNGTGVKSYQQPGSTYYSQNKVTSPYTSSSPYATLPRQAQPPKQPVAPVNQTLHIDTHSEPVPYKALYNYRPQNEDELELREGDTVYVMEKCDDGWYVGSSQRTGFFGTFPGNYVERL